MKNDNHEEGISFSANKIFYNSEMRFCRSFSSLAIGVIGEKLDVLDGFCASGIRGIRYAKENKNVRSVTFLDWSKNATGVSKKKGGKNKKKKGEVGKGGAVKVLGGGAEESDFDVNFIELDPF